MGGDIIEQIARRWFETEPSTHAASYDSQPESVKEVFRARARQFWLEPGKLTRVLQGVAVRTRQSTSDIERASAAWLAE